MSGFEELGLMPGLVHAVEDMQWYLPRPVQQEAIPLILGGGHVMCAAETGSGKTGAFSLPMLQVTWEALNRRSSKTSSTRCVINPDDCNTNCKISADGLLMQCHDARGWGGARCTFGVRKGRWYYEAVVVEENGIVRLGFSTAQGGLELGKDSFGFGYGGTGKKSFAGVFDDYGGTFGAGDRIGVAIDVDSGSLTYYKNGTSLGEAFKIPADLHGAAFHPCACVKNSLVEFVFSPKHVKCLPKGFSAMDDAAGPEQDEIAAEVQRKLRSVGGTGPTCIVVEPTLELCNQVIAETVKFTKHLSNPAIKLATVVGKRETREIVTELKRGADIVVGTPGKLESFVDSGTIPLANVRFLIMDEADRFANEHFNFVTKLFGKIQGANQGRTQVCMFSATLHSPEIRRLATEICPQATWVDLKGKEYVPETVHHAVVYVDPVEAKWQADGMYTTDGVHAKDKVQGDVYGSEGTKHLKAHTVVKLIEAYKMPQGIVFCRTRLDCDNLAAYLTARGGKKPSGSFTDKGKENLYSNVALHSGFSPKQRDERLTMFKEGYVRFLICTDVAARGIDIQGLPYVINVTLPDKSEDYIHRVGRTGRADRMGLAISIVSRCKEKVWYHTCPSRGEGCTNTNVAEPVPGGAAGQMRGGCCIWYNEPALADAIEKRLGQQLDELDHKTLKYHIDGAEADTATFGRTKQEAKRQVAGLSDQRRSSIAAVTALDKAAQQTFLRNEGVVADILKGI